MKQRLYLETSTLNAYFDDRPPLRQRATQQFWTLLGSYEVFISDQVAQEIRISPEPRRGQLSGLTEGIPILSLTEEARTLATRYIELEAFTPRRRLDAHHVAIATTAGMDYLVSWNFRHIAREWTRTRVQAANLEMGYNRVIRIVTPTDLLGGLS
jgi:hypothetical protein